MAMDDFISILLFLSVIGCSSTQNVSFPLELPAIMITSENGTCPSAAEREATLQTLLDQVDSLIQEQVIPTLRSRPPCPCGGPGDWTRIAHLNMSDPAQQCPPNWNLINTPVRGCGHGSASCESATFPSSGRSHSRVCGRINAYQRGSTDAFDSSSYIRGAFDIQNPGLEDPYLDGVSLTHGTAHLVLCLCSL